MAYQIIWAAEADNDFHSIICYLRENWSEHTAEKFATKTMNKLERIASKPFVPRFTAQPNVQIIKFDRKNVVFFTIENDDMILLSIYPYKKILQKANTTKPKEMGFTSQHKSSSPARYL